METIVSAKRPRDTPFVERAAACFGIPRAEFRIAAFQVPDDAFDYEKLCLN